VIVRAAAIVIGLALIWFMREHFGALAAIGAAAAFLLGLVVASTNSAVQSLHSDHAVQAEMQAILSELKSLASKLHHNLSKEEERLHEDARLRVMSKVTPEVAKSILDSARSGNEIEALRQLRAVTYLDLLEARYMLNHMLRSES
jgi:DNA topoisomerase VI subunit B